jgi:hypothetical protein
MIARVRDRVFSLLKEKGPMHLDEIQKALGLDHGQASSLMINSKSYFVRVSRGVYGISENAPITCPHCHGTGKIKPESNPL